MENIVAKNNFQNIFVNIIFYFLSVKNDFLIKQVPNICYKYHVHGENDFMDVIFGFLSFF